MLMLGTIPLIVPSNKSELTDLQKVVDENIPTQRTCPWVGQCWPGPGLIDVAYPTGFWMPVKPQVGYFRWMWGASRWSHGWLLASTNQVSMIQNRAFAQQAGNGIAEGQPVPIQLYADSPGIRSEENLTTNVYVLAINALQRTDPPTGQKIPFVNGLYLITVVDERWFWQGIKTPFFDMATSTTWLNIINDCANSLNITPTVDPVNVNYLKPNSSWNNVEGEVLPTVFDAILANVGMRLVKNYNGSYHVMNATTAQETIDNDNLNNKERTFRAGDDRFESQL